MNLDECRSRIDALDKELVRLLNERTRMALEIGRIKQETGGEIYAPAREKAVFDRISAANEGPLPAEALQAIYREVMSAALALERPLRIAFLGPQATFTHQAARLKFGASVSYVPCETITDVFTTVEKRLADYGVVPIENSTDGAVTHTLDQFAVTPLRICAEILLPVAQHYMVADPDAHIGRICSKAEVFGQCRRWIQSHMPAVELRPVSSTARGAEMASAEPTTAAIASELAAELYGLRIVARDVQDVSGNTTRFLVIARVAAEPTGEDKTTLLFSVRHESGALFRAIEVFARAGINLLKIESRPNRSKAWEYNFFVDLEGRS
ncbi:MAG: prephenate dehydratase, partial [Kiritimatiellae bacterium]|nr:prephenate dehydratase [Kiritimatiellia bacterium]